LHSACLLETRIAHPISVCTEGHKMQVLRLVSAGRAALLITVAQWQYTPHTPPSPLHKVIAAKLQHDLSPISPFSQGSPPWTLGICHEDLSDLENIRYVLLNTNLGCNWRFMQSRCRTPGLLVASIKIGVKTNAVWREEVGRLPACSYGEGGVWERLSASCSSPCS